MKLLLVIFALAVSLYSFAYGVYASRKVKRIEAERQRMTCMGRDEWVAEKVRLWREGKLKSHLEKDGSRIREIIEPLPGWRIQVANNRT